MKYAPLYVIAVLVLLLCLTGCKQPTTSQVQVERFFEGTKQEVTVYTIKGKQKGPILVMFAGIHGDELSCPVVAERYTTVSLTKGTLIIVPRLNLHAITLKRRNGLGGDMNRLFHLPEHTHNNPDIKVVNLAKELIKKADYVLNLHQGSGFYSPVWISDKRNPRRWGQCNVIDAPSFDLPNGDKLELENFAVKVALKINRTIEDKNYYFLVNNTNTMSQNSLHKEQRKSLTYYALTKEHKIALGIEVTKNCSYNQALFFLTTAINAAIQEAGIVAEKLPT